MAILLWGAELLPVMGKQTEEKTKSIRHCDVGSQLWNEMSLQILINTVQ